MRPLLRFPAVVLLILALGLSGCTATPVGTAVKFGQINKTGVEALMSEVIRLDCASHDPRGAVPGCVKKIDEPTYQRAASAYNVYEAAQRAYADAIVAWTRVKSGPNDARLTTASDQLEAQLKNAVAVLCSLKAYSPGLAATCGQMGG